MANNLILKDENIFKKKLNLFKKLRKKNSYQLWLT